MMAEPETHHGPFHNYDTSTIRSKGSAARGRGKRGRGGRTFGRGGRLSITEPNGFKDAGLKKVTPARRGRFKQYAERSLQAASERKQELATMYRRFAVLQKDALAALAGAEAGMLKEDPHYHETAPEHALVRAQLKEKLEAKLVRDKHIKCFQDAAANKARDYEHHVIDAQHQGTINESQEEFWDDILYKLNLLGTIRENKVPLDCPDGMHRYVKVPVEQEFGVVKHYNSNGIFVPEPTHVEGSPEARALRVAKEAVADAARKGKFAPRRSRLQAIQEEGEPLAATAAADVTRNPSPNDERSNPDSSAQLPVISRSASEPDSHGFRLLRTRGSRIMGPQYYQFESHEIGFRDSANCSKSTQARASRAALLDKPNSVGFYFDPALANGIDVRDYDANTLDKELVAKYKLHPRYGFFTADSVNESELPLPTCATRRPTVLVDSEGREIKTTRSDIAHKDDEAVQSRLAQGICLFSQMLQESQDTETEEDEAPKAKTAGPTPCKEVVACFGKPLGNHNGIIRAAASTRSKRAALLRKNGPIMARTSTRDDEAHDNEADDDNAIEKSVRHDTSGIDALLEASHLVSSTLSPPAPPSAESPLIRLFMLCESASRAQTAPVEAPQQTSDTQQQAAYPYHAPTEGFVDHGMYPMEPQTPARLARPVVDQTPPTTHWPHVQHTPFTPAQEPPFSPFVRRDIMAGHLANPMPAPHYSMSAPDNYVHDESANAARPPHPEPEQHQQQVPVIIEPEFSEGEPSRPTYEASSRPSPGSSYSYPNPDTIARSTSADMWETEQQPMQYGGAYAGENRAATPLMVAALAPAVGEASSNPVDPAMFAIDPSLSLDYEGRQTPLRAAPEERQQQQPEQQYNAAQAYGSAPAPVWNGPVEPRFEGQNIEQGQNFEHGQQFGAQNYEQGPPFEQCRYDQPQPGFGPSLEHRFGGQPRFEQGQQPRVNPELGQQQYEQPRVDPRLEQSYGQPRVGAGFERNYEPPREHSGRGYEPSREHSGQQQHFEQATPSYTQPAEQRPEPHYPQPFAHQHFLSVTEPPRPPQPAEQQPYYAPAGPQAPPPADQRYTQPTQPVQSAPPPLPGMMPISSPRPILPEPRPSRQSRFGHPGDHLNRARQFGFSLRPDKPRPTSSVAPPLAPAFSFDVPDAAPPAPTFPAAPLPPPTESRKHSRQRSSAKGSRSSLAPSAPLPPLGPPQPPTQTHNNYRPMALQYGAQSSVPPPSGVPFGVQSSVPPPSGVQSGVQSNVPPSSGMPSGASSGQQLQQPAPPPPPQFGQELAPYTAPPLQPQPQPYGQLPPPSIMVQYGGEPTPVSAQYTGPPVSAPLHPSTYGPPQMNGGQYSQYAPPPYTQPYQPPRSHTKIAPTPQSMVPLPPPPSPHRSSPHHGHQQWFSHGPAYGPPGSTPYYSGVPLPPIQTLAHDQPSHHSLPPPQPQVNGLVPLAPAPTPGSGPDGYRKIAKAPHREPADNAQSMKIELYNPQLSIKDYQAAPTTAPASGGAADGGNGYNNVRFASDVRKKRKSDVLDGEEGRAARRARGSR